MDDERLEFFKLDEPDRKVLFWLMDNVDTKSVRSWIEYISRDYREKGILIDSTKLYKETLQMDE